MEAWRWGVALLCISSGGQAGDGRADGVFRALNY